MPKKVLIVEDEARLAEILADALKDIGLEVIVARDGEQGLNAALEKHPNLILLDLLLPKKEGLTVLKELRAHETGAKTPVIVLTNLNDVENINKALESGVSSFLVKSNWDIDSLLQEIKAAIG